MPTTRIRCHVLEVDRNDDWLPRRNSPRDLLPWADPYIASLIHRLEQRYDCAEVAEDLCDPFAADDASFCPADFDGGWHGEALAAGPLEASTHSWRPPVYGGFPLLDDGGPSDVADASKVARRESPRPATTASPPARRGWLVQKLVALGLMQPPEARPLRQRRTDLVHSGRAVSFFTQSATPLFPTRGEPKD